MNSLKSQRNATRFALVVTNSEEKKLMKIKIIVINNIRWTSGNIGIIIILTFLSFLFPTSSRGETEYDFRNTKWGMTKEEVKACEPGRLSKEAHLNEKEVVSYGFDEIIMYVDKTTSINVQIHYSFLNDHLIHAAYFLLEQFEDKTLYITAFDKVREALNNKYGLPITDNKTRLDNKYKTNRGSALESGDLYLHTSWETRSTKIDLCLSKNTDANIVNLMVIYGSRDLVHMKYF
jgi:hypothetical protein